MKLSILGIIFCFIAAYLVTGLILVVIVGIFFAFAAKKLPKEFFERHTVRFIKQMEERFNFDEIEAKRIRIYGIRLTRKNAIKIGTYGCMMELFLKWPLFIINGGPCGPRKEEDDD